MTRVTAGLGQMEKLRRECVRMRDGIEDLYLMIGSWTEVEVVIVMQMRNQLDLDSMQGL